MCVWILVLLATAYLFILAILRSQQERFLYPAPPVDNRSTGGFEEVTYSTEDGLELVSGFRAAERSKPTLLYFHGNGTTWMSSVGATEHLVAAGYGVLAAEYRSYGGNPGRPSVEGLYVDGRAAMAFLSKRDIDANNLVIVGNSIGSGVAVQMALEVQPRALILISPFSSLTSLVAEKFRWLPTDRLLRGRYDNLSKMASIDGEVLILHGDADHLIPRTHADRLAAGSENVRLQIFSDIGHDLAWRDAAQHAMLSFLQKTFEREDNP